MKPSEGMSQTAEQLLVTLGQPECRQHRVPHQQERAERPGVWLCKKEPSIQGRSQTHQVHIGACVYEAIGKEGDSGGRQGLLAPPVLSPLSPVSSDLGGIRDSPGSEYSSLGKEGSLLTCSVYSYACVISMCASECAVPVCPAEGGRKSHSSSPSPSPWFSLFLCGPSMTTFAAPRSRVACWLGPPLRGRSGPTHPDSDSNQPLTQHYQGS